MNEEPFIPYLIFTRQLCLPAPRWDINIAAGRYFMPHRVPPFLTNNGDGDNTISGLDFLKMNLTLLVMGYRYACIMQA